MTIMMIPLKQLSSTDGLKLFSRKPSQSISHIKNSIFKDGLLNPLVVTQQEKNYQVIDGKKRLNAIKWIAKYNRLSQGSKKIPCVFHEENHSSITSANRPALLSCQELAHAILRDVDLGASSSSVALRYECATSVIEDALSLRKLHPKLLQHFNNQNLTLEQAAAFATFDNTEAQLRLFEQLGQFVTNQEIMSKIRTGSNVIEFPDGSIIILPSRKPPAQVRLKYENTKQADTSSKKRCSMRVAA